MPASCTSRPFMLRVLVATSTSQAVAQTAPDYSKTSTTQCIPFAHRQREPFTHTPVLSFSVAEEPGTATGSNGQPIAAESLNKGYIIGRQGIQVGLTAMNTQGFRFARLEPFTQYPGDWRAPAACITVDPAINRTAEGPICTPATVLVDTGIPQSYLTLPKAIQFKTVKAQDASVPTKTVSVLAPGTVVQVQIPGLPAIATEAFTVGDGSPAEPKQVISWHTDKRRPFINTGRHLLRQFQFLYDARQGFIGFKEQSEACGE